MPILDSFSSGPLEFALHVERLYQSLIKTSVASGEPGLGGTLLYAGALDSEGRALMVAANIAGCASLAASADSGAQKQAVRDGVADFLVNSLDEALRILKNEIRKHEPVAVCIALAPEAVEREMLERGVIPDLLRQEPVCENMNDVLWWRVDSAPAQWLPRLDAIAMQCLREANREALMARRWLRQSPCYLGRLAQGLRVLRCDTDAAKRFLAEAESAIKTGEIAVGVSAGFGGGNEGIRLGS